MCRSRYHAVHDGPASDDDEVSLVINLKTAKALGLTVPLIMQMTTDEVIE